MDEELKQEVIDYLKRDKYLEDRIITIESKNNSNYIHIDGVAVGSSYRHFKESDLIPNNIKTEAREQLLYSIKEQVLKDLERRIKWAKKKSMY